MAKKKEDREIIYPVRESLLCYEGSEGFVWNKETNSWETTQLAPLTIAEAKDIIGWEETEERKGSALIDDDGKHIRLSHNKGNRPLNASHWEELRQEVLTGNWKFNMSSTIVISKYGTLTNGQHTIVGFIMAGQRWHKNQERWLEKWPEEPTLSIVVNRGADEDDETLRTIDSAVRPRSLADVLYTMNYFPAYDNRERLKLCQITSLAVKTIWERTGRGQVIDYRTNTMLFDFAQAHPKVVECVETIYKEDDNPASSNISKLFAAGYAAGFMYLMGCSGSNVDDYRNADPAPNESVLNWDRMDAAVEFWVRFSAKQQGQRELCQLLASLTDPENTTGGIVSEKKATVAKAWNIWMERPLKMSVKEENEWYSQNMSKAKLRIESETDNEGRKHPTEWPKIGGIDLGESKDEHEEADEPTPEEVVEIEERKKAAIEEKHNGNGKRKPAPKKKAPAPKAKAKGNGADKDGEALDNGAPALSANANPKPKRKAPPVAKSKKK